MSSSCTLEPACFALLYGTRDAAELPGALDAVDLDGEGCLAEVASRDDEIALGGLAEFVMVSLSGASSAVDDGVPLGLRDVG